MSRRGERKKRAVMVLVAALACLATVLVGSFAAAAASEAGTQRVGSGLDRAGKGGGSKGGKGGKRARGTLRTAVTRRRAERVDLVPIANRAGQSTRSVVSLKLPRLNRGDRVRLNGEVTITLTCADPNSRCIGRSYRFDPHLRARMVLAGDPDATGGRSATTVSHAVGLTCEQTRPNRNHHCPLVIKAGSFSVKKLRKLPCKPTKCRLNIVLDAYHREASSDEYVVVGADQEGGGVEGGKARASAVISHGRVESATRKTKREVSDELPASFEGGKRVTYSQKLDNLDRGDVLVVQGRQRTAISNLPYFVSTQVVLTTRRKASRPSKLSRRAVSRSGLATETNGFNCTLGPSAFRSPCVSIKAGMATIERVPRDRRGHRRPLYVNLVSRAFPKLAQARGRYAPARVLDGGSLTVKRLRPAKPRGGSGGKGGKGGGGKGRG